MVMEYADLLRYLNKEIPFKTSMDSINLLRHLEKQIPFKVAVGSTDLLRHLGSKLISRNPWALWIY